MPRDLRPRYADLAEGKMEPLSENNADYLKSNITDYLFDTFGLQLDEDLRAPKRSGVIPRMFVLGKNAGGKDFLLDANELPFKPNSGEFLEQIRLGNVFVYPAGKSKPVQLQIDPPPAPGRSFTLACSEPFEPEQVPPPPVKPLTGLQKFLRVLSLGLAYRREAREWEKAQTDHADLQEKLRDQEAVSDAELEGETAAFKDEQKHRVEAKDLETARANKEAPRLGTENFISVFKPVPEKREDMLKFPQGHPLGQKYAFYKETDFRDLTIFTDDEAAQREKLKKQDDEIEKHTDAAVEELKADKTRKVPLPEIRPGGNHPDFLAGGKDYQFESFPGAKLLIEGKPLTDAQFSAVALAACFQPKNMLANSISSKDTYDPTLVPSLMNCGLTEDEAKAVVGGHERNMGATDLFLVPPRDSEGVRIRDYVNVGRREAADAFRQYQKGNREPLASLLAQGVNSFAGEFSTITGKRFPTQQRGVAIMGRELIGLLQQDPALAELAKEQGMDPKRLDTLKGMANIEKLEAQGRQAEYELAKARYDRRELDVKEKTDLSKQILMSHLAISRLNRHRSGIEKDQNSRYNQLMNSIQWVSPPVNKKTGRPLPMNELPMPPAGQVYNTSMMQAAGGFHFVFDPLPQVAEDLNSPKGIHDLEAIAEEIVRQEKLTEKTNDELFQSLNGRTLNLDASALKATKALLQQRDGKKMEPVMPEKAQEKGMGEQPQPDELPILGGQ